MISSLITISFPLSLLKTHFFGGVEVAVSCHFSTALEQSLLALTHLMNHHPDSYVQSATLLQDFEKLAWSGCCLGIDACTLGNPFRSSTGLEFPALQRPEAFGSLEDQQEGQISSSCELWSKLTNSLDGVVERRDPLEDSPSEYHHGSSFEPIYDVVYGWERISGKLYRMSRLAQLSFLCHLNEALATRSPLLSIGTFRRRIPEPVVQVSRPDVHSTGSIFFLSFPSQRIGAPRWGSSSFDHQRSLIPSLL
ncbi:hypothetical protein M5K25_016054 [Dendrobium thyrsiflorum]|uniref:Uncharacterized protein n=1 Tax=Dendrobium thyrsiflorum TaxID=117978 RepID=A0ABD0UZ68_DENTH